ncbi:hypothetical protein JCM8547_001651 [Rhodosporidiobolus lusitaniae]
MSLSIVDSLHNSRHTLLHDAFPPSPSHLPHTLTPLGSTTLSIGPHFFLSCPLFLATFSSSSPFVVTSSSSSAKPVFNPTEITPDLISRLNTAAQTDLGLAELLRKAATGQASTEELNGLAQYIEGIKGGGAPSAAAAGAGGEKAPEHPCVVFSFPEHEGSGKRFILPTHTYYTPLALGTVSSPFPSLPPTHSSSSSAAPQTPPQDLLLSFFLFPSHSPSLVSRYNQRLASLSSNPAVVESLAPPTAPVPVDLVVHQAGQEMREGLWKGARNCRSKEEKVEGWWREMIASVPPRLHVLHTPPAPPLLPSASSAIAAGERAGSVGLSRQASEQALGGSNKRGGTPIAEGSKPAAKKAKGGGGGGKKKPAPRASSSRARSKTSTSASVSNTPLAASPSLSGLPSPSPAPSASEDTKPAKRAPARRASTRKGKGKGKVKVELDEDGDPVYEEDDGGAFKG